MMEREFRAFWKSATNTNGKNIERALDELDFPLVYSSDAKSDFPNFRREDCPFDQGDAIERSFFESSSTRVLANIAPIVHGHCLVVPKRHVERLEDLTEIEVVDLFEPARRVSDTLLSGLGASGVNWALQDGVDAGQSVPHFHLHIIPRRSGDLADPGEWFAELPVALRWLAPSINRPERD